MVRTCKLRARHVRSYHGISGYDVLDQACTGHVRCPKLFFLRIFNIYANRLCKEVEIVRATDVEIE